jgi:hypothetical protein
MTLRPWTIALDNGEGDWSWVSDTNTLEDAILVLREFRDRQHWPFKYFYFIFNWDLGVWVVVT